MRFKSPAWRPVAYILSGLNVLGAAFAVASAEPMHAGAHMTVALAFGFWSERLRRQARRVEADVQLDDLEAELSHLRTELTDVSDRMDFVERLQAREPDPHRLGPNR